MTLHYVSAESRVGSHSALAVDFGAYDELAQIRPIERLGREADAETILVKGQHGQTRAIDADTVSDVTVAQDRRRIAYRQNVFCRRRGWVYVRYGRYVLYLPSAPCSVLTHESCEHVEYESERVLFKWSS